MVPRFSVGWLAKIWTYSCHLSPNRPSADFNCTELHANLWVLRGLFVFLHRTNAKPPHTQFHYHFVTQLRDSAAIASCANSCSKLTRTDRLIFSSQSHNPGHLRGKLGHPCLALSVTHSVAWSVQWWRGSQHPSATARTYSILRFQNNDPFQRISLSRGIPPPSFKLPKWLTVFDCFIAWRRAIVSSFNSSTLLAASLANNRGSCFVGISFARGSRDTEDVVQVLLSVATWLWWRPWLFARSRHLPPVAHLTAACRSCARSGFCRHLKLLADSWVSRLGALHNSCNTYCVMPATYSRFCSYIAVLTCSCLLFNESWCELFSTFPSIICHHSTRTMKLKLQAHINFQHEN